MNVVKYAVLVLGLLTVGVGSASADEFSHYQATGSTFTLPTSAYDVSGGLIHYLDGDTIYRQSAFGSTSFVPVGHLGGSFSPSSFPAFLEVSPDGTRFAVGNSGGADFGTFQVAVFDASALNSGNPDLSGAASIYAVNHNAATWVDDRYLLLTGGTFGSPSVVTKLDTASSPSSPVNTVVVNNIGGASAGVALDALGNLFTGNGFDGPGASGTGWIKGINAASWQGSPPVNFETSASAKFIADLLSAGSLKFDSEGNLLVGGGDFGSGDLNYFGLISAAAVQSAMAGGVINTGDPTQVRKFDPSASDSSFYTLAVDRQNHLFYALDGTTAYQFGCIPEPSTCALLALGVVGLAWAVRKRKMAVIGIGLGILAMASTARADQFYAQDVVNFTPGTGITEGTGFGITSRILGGPRGGGAGQAGLDVLSLGVQGSVTVGFGGEWIQDLPGADFTVFENPFYVGGNTSAVFGELAFVEVSSDGTQFARFPTSSTNPGPIGPFNTLNPTLVSGFTGSEPVLANVDTNTINPFDPSVSGGNSFDLASLASNPLVLSGAVKLSQIRYVRIVDVLGDGTSLDSFGRPIYDATGLNNSADIDAVAVLHGIPEPSTAALGALGLVGLCVGARRKLIVPKRS